MLCYVKDSLLANQIILFTHGSKVDGLINLFLNMICEFGFGY